jgi:hypothetical protein
MRYLTSSRASFCTLAGSLQKLDFATRAQAAKAKENIEPANEYHFRASGYNLQLKKRLSFEGNYNCAISLS